MINGSFEISQSSGSGNQQEEEENNRKGSEQNGNRIESGIEKGKMVLDKFVCEEIVIKNKEQYPDFPLTKSGEISIEEIMKHKDFSEEEREEIKKVWRATLIQKAKIEKRFVLKLEEFRRPEKLLMAIIHKVIGDKFFISKAAEYDDFFKRVDIIIAKQTDKGLVPICVLDITVSSKSRDKRQQEVVDIKKKAAYKRNLSGGAELNFFGSKNRKRYNIPIFCVFLEREKMSSCLNNFTFPLSEEELEIFNIFINSIEEQVTKLEKKGQKLRNKDQLIEKQITKLEKMSLRLQDKRQSIEKQITKSKRIRRRLQDKRQSIEKQITEFETKNQLIEEQIAEFEIEGRLLLNLLENQISSLKTEVGEWKNSYEEKLALVGRADEKL